MAAGNTGAMSFPHKELKWSGERMLILDFINFECQCLSGGPQGVAQGAGCPPYYLGSG